MTVTIPNITNKDAGVYKFILNGEYTYIGGSLNLLSRMKSHVNAIKNGTCNSAIKSVIENGVISIYFEVLEIVTNYSELGIIENRYLDTNYSDKSLNIMKSCGKSVLVKMERTSGYMAEEMINIIKEYAKADGRSFSVMVEMLCAEAIQHRIAKTKK